MTNSQNPFILPPPRILTCLKGFVFFAVVCLLLSQGAFADTVNVTGMNDGTNYKDKDIVDKLEKKVYNHTGTISGNSSLTINSSTNSSSYRQKLSGTYTFTGPITVNNGQLLAYKKLQNTTLINLKGGDMYIIYGDCLPHNAVVNVGSGSMLDTEGADNAIQGATINISSGGALRLGAKNLNSSTLITLNIAGAGRPTSSSPQNCPGAITGYNSETSNVSLAANINLTANATIAVDNIGSSNYFYISGKLTESTFLKNAVLTFASDSAGRNITLESSGSAQLNMSEYTGNFVVDKVKVRFYTDSLGTGSNITVQNSGTALFNNTSALNAYTGSFTVNNGTISLEAAGKLNNITGNGNVTIGANALTLNITDNTSFDGVISGTGTMAKIGDGTLTLSGANTYTGATTVTAGTLKLSGASASLSTPSITVSSGGVFQSGVNIGNTEIITGDGGVFVVGNTYDSASVTTNAVTFNSGAINFDFNNSAGSGDYDKITTGAISGASGVVNVSFNYGDESSWWNSADGTDGFCLVSGTSVGDISGLSLNVNGSTTSNWALSALNNSIYLVPTGTEPGDAKYWYANNPTAAGQTSWGIDGSSKLGAKLLSGENKTVTYSNPVPMSDDGLFDVAESYNLTLDNAVSGSGKLTKTGDGTLTLSGNNSYSGGTTVTEGTLAVSNASALGTGAVTMDGGTLDATATGNNAAFSNGIVVGENGGTVSVASGNYSSFASVSGSGDLTTNGKVQFNATDGYNGSLTVNSGSTQINPGTDSVFDLTINSGAQFSVLNPGTIKIGKLSSTDNVEFVLPQTGADYTLEIGSGTTSSDVAVYAGYIHGAAANSNNITIKKVGDGAQKFQRAGNGFNSTAGTIKEIIVDSGKMIIEASGFSAGSTSGFWGTAPITVNSNGTLVYNGLWNTSPNTMLTINGGTLTNNSYQYQNLLTLNSATVNGNEGAELRVGYKGSGVWNVTGGTSTIYNNIITVKSGNYTTFTINIADGAALDIKKNIAGLTDNASYKGTNLVVNGMRVGDSELQGTGKIKFNPAAGSTMTDMGTISFNNVHVELDGNAGWLGNGYFNGSAVTLTNSTMTTNTNHTTNTSVFTLDNSTLIFDGKVISYINEITLKNGSEITGTTTDSQFRTGHNWNSIINTKYVSGEPEMNTISADIVMHDPTKTMTFNIADKAPLTFSGKFIPAAADQYSENHNNLLVKTGAGVLTLTGDNSSLYQTVTISAGKLVLAENGTLGTSAVTNNATLEFAYTSDKDFGNAISGTGAVIKSGSGTLTLTQQPGYTGATTVESGTLALSAGGTLYNLSGAGDVNYGENALTVSNSETTTFSGDILGSGAFKKTGTGKLTLAQAPEYTGSTTVESGTLALADGGTLYNLSGGSLDANGNVTTFITLPADKDLLLSNSVKSKFIGSITAATIEKTDKGTLQICTGANGQVDAQSLVVSSGRLDFKGYMTHNITVDANAVFSPGNSVGEARFGGNYELNDGATMLLEIGRDENEQIVADKLIVDGNAMFATGSIIEIGLDDSSSLKGGDTFEVPIITATNAAVIESSIDKSLRSYYFTDLSISRDGNTIYLSGRLDPNAVPEPSTWALLALGVCGLLYLRKRS